MWSSIYGELWDAENKAANEKMSGSLEFEQCCASLWNALQSTSFYLIQSQPLQLRTTLNHISFKFYFNELCS